MKEIIYYKSNEILENKYYQVPQELFENPLYKNNLNSDSKILYGFLLDRLPLSQKNHWFDTDFTNPYISLNEIKEKCELNTFSKEEQIILEDVIDNLYYSENLKVGLKM